MPKFLTQAILLKLSAVLLALLFVAGILLMLGTNPLQAFGLLLSGSVCTVGKFADVLIVFAPLLLVACGLLVTFAAGLWNIGVEGQIMIGAVFSTWALKGLQDSLLPPWLVILLAILAGMLGGGLWAVLAGALKTFGGVNEIFGGLGLNFVASALTLWLIFGPWKRPGIGSMSGTEPFSESLWLPQVAGTRLSVWALVLALTGLVFVYVLLKKTLFGLKLKAVGRNPRSAYMLGIPTWQHMLMGFLLCGAMAGAAGALQVTAVYHRLIPSISSGYGYLGLLIAMLVNVQPIWVAPVAFFFAALNIGSIQLPIVMQLDSSLSGVLQGTLVLFILLAEGVRRRFLTVEKEAA